MGFFAAIGILFVALMWNFDIFDLFSGWGFSGDTITNNWYYGNESGNTTTEGLESLNASAPTCIRFWIVVAAFVLGVIVSPKIKKYIS